MQYCKTCRFGRCCRQRLSQRAILVLSSGGGRVRGRTPPGQLTLPSSRAGSRFSTYQSGALLPASVSRRYFLWLVAHWRCWTTDRLEKRGLPHPTYCVFCDQLEETVDHILIGCLESLQLWWTVLSSPGLPQCFPSDADSFFEWHCSCRLKVPREHRRGFNTIVTLGGWSIWKEKGQPCVRQPFPALA